MRLTLADVGGGEGWKSVPGQVNTFVQVAVSIQITQSVL